MSNFPFIRLALLSLFLVGCSSTGGPQKAPENEVRADSRRIRFVFPLKKYRRISRGFKGRHKGLDVSAKKNTPIYAAESGWVIYKGRGFRGYGKLVILEHSKNWASFYAHMNKYKSKEKQWVNKGDVIGYVGRTGRSTGDHLHFEIRFQNQAVDPMNYLNTGWWAQVEVKEKLKDIAKSQAQKMSARQPRRIAKNLLRKSPNKNGTKDPESEEEKVYWTTK